MEQVYKINHLSLNDSKSQFCLCYNNGIRTFSTENFLEKYCSDNLGSISLANLVHELNMVVFVGSESNDLYSSKKIVIYDLITQKSIYSTRFQSEIKNLNIINKYLFIGFESEIKIFSLEKKDTIIPIKEIPLPECDKYEIWDKSSNKIISLTKICLAYPFKDEICINSFIGNELNLERKKDIKSPSKKIQNIFYIKKLNYFFTPDETAYYIYGFDSDEGKQKICLYRGKSPGIITSITLLNKNYLALNNLNRTIHIFNIGENTNNYNLGNLIGGFFYGSYISPFMRIKYFNIMKEKEGEFYESDFQKKGALLSSEDDGIDLNIISYNGYAIKLRINFLKKEFEIIEKEKYAQYKINKNKEEESIDESNIFSSYNSIFESEKANKNQEKFVVYQ